MTKRPLLLGLDVGTQSLRAALIDERGSTVGFGVAPITTRFPRPGWAEQEPLDWWAAAEIAVRLAVSEAGVDSDQIEAIGLDCTSCTVVACDDHGEPIHPALLWMDQRSADEAARINATASPSLRFVSGRVSPEWMLPKALWLKLHEPAIYDRADRIVECTDWFMHRLTGHWTLSLNHVAVKWNYAKIDGGWPKALMKSVGLDDLIGKWPDEIVPLGGGTGTLSKRAAKLLGLRDGIPVAQGGIDAYLGMIGMGATEVGDVAIIIGSSTCHLAQSEKGIFQSGASGCFPDATIEGLYTLEAGQTATGSLLDWYRRHFAGAEENEAKRLGVPVFSILDARASEVEPGCDGVLVRDDWQGNRSPFKNPGARGAITGLSLSHGPGHIVRGIYEATACGTRQILEDASTHGLPVTRILVGGGGARSLLWLQIHADVLNRPMNLTRETESCALGSAMTAAVAAGIYPNLATAAANMVHVDRVIEPIKSHVSIYDEIYKRYCDLYDRLNSP